MQLSEGRELGFFFTFAEAAGVVAMRENEGEKDDVGKSTGDNNVVPYEKLISGAVFVKSHRPVIFRGSL